MAIAAILAEPRAGTVAVVRSMPSPAMPIHCTSLAAASPLCRTAPLAAAAAPQPRLARLRLDARPRRSQRPGRIARASGRAVGGRGQRQPGAVACAVAARPAARDATRSRAPGTPTGKTSTPSTSTASTTCWSPTPATTAACARSCCCTWLRGTGAARRRRQLKPAWSIAFRWPDGPRDCEAIAVDAARGKVLLISKKRHAARTVLRAAATTRGAGVQVAGHIGHLTGVPEANAEDAAKRADLRTLSAPDHGRRPAPDGRMLGGADLRHLLFYPARRRGSWATGGRAPARKRATSPGCRKPRRWPGRPAAAACTPPANSTRRRCSIPLTPDQRPDRAGGA